MKIEFCHSVFHKLGAKSRLFLKIGRKWLEMMNTISSSMLLFYYDNNKGLELQACVLMDISRTNSKLFKAFNQKWSHHHHDHKIVCFLQVFVSFGAKLDFLLDSFWQTLKTYAIILKMCNIQIFSQIFFT